MSFVECFTVAAGLLSEFQGSASSTPSRCPSNSLCRVNWKPPLSGWFKLNSNASILRDGLTGLGGAIRNCEGGVCRLFSSHLPFCSDVALAEALACRLGIRLAIESGIQNLMVETDNQEISRLLHSKCVPPSIVGTVIADMIHMTSCFEQISFSWTKRSSNILAHRIARLACNSSFAELSEDSMLESLKPFVMANIANLNYQ